MIRESLMVKTLYFTEHNPLNLRTGQETLVYQQQSRKSKNRPHGRLSQDVRCYCSTQEDLKLIQYSSMLADWRHWACISLAYMKCTSQYVLIRHKLTSLVIVSFLYICNMIFFSLRCLSGLPIASSSCCLPPSSDKNWELIRFR